MRKSGIYVLMVILAFAVSGCEQKPSDTVSNDLNKTTESLQEKSTKALQSIEDQVDNLAIGTAKLQEAKEEIKKLIAKANEYLNSGDYEAAIATAKKVLADFDPNSSEAKSIIERAKEAIAKIAKEKADELSADAAGSVEEMKNTLGSFGQ